MKITIIGGGSTYTPELISGLIKLKDSVAVREVCLMDIDPLKLETIARYCQRMVDAHGSSFKIVTSLELEEAVCGSAYVVTQLRVGGLAARREDEYLGARHGLIGQETTGVGGMAKALRTIPVILNICRTIEETAPDALLINFTNPAGLVTEAISRFAPNVQAVGVCNIPITTQMRFCEVYEEMIGKPVVFEETALDSLGLNHLSWHRGFKVNGKDVWDELFPVYKTYMKGVSDESWDDDLLDVLGMIPNYYLQYFYYTGHKIAAQKEWPPSRAEEVMQIEKQLLKIYQEHDGASLPEELMERGGAYYSTLAAHLIKAHSNDTGQIFNVNVPHRGMVAGWPPDWVLEMPCRIDAKGIHPQPTEPLPEVCFGLLAKVKAYEILTAQAAVDGDRKKAHQALLVHPLGPEADKIGEVLDDLLTINAPYLPQFDHS